MLPGVTVEAASPVLIEKVRSAISDGSGRYNIIDLRPGTYTVTFSLPGFANVVREGINLPTSFTATVDAEMRVGGLEETITVSGQTPLVDLQSATQQVVLSKELMEAVPTGRNLWGVGGTMNGVTLSSPDVGGTAGGVAVAAGVDQAGSLGGGGGLGGHLGVPFVGGLVASLR